MISDFIYFFQSLSFRPSFFRLDRSLSRLVDQIRVYCQNRYEFSYHADLVDGIQYRMRQFRDRDLHSIAAQHLTNIQKLPSSGAKLPDALRRMKKKLQGKTDG